MDKLILWGACAVMAVVGSLSLWKISQIPKIDPAIVKLRGEFDRMMKGPVTNPPPPLPYVHIAFLDPVAEARPAPDAAATLRTRAEGTSVAHPIAQVFILPMPVIGSAKADLDGATITWTLEDPKATLLLWQRWNRAKPAGFIVERQCGDGAKQRIATLGPDAKSFTDLSAEPKRTYRYWVLTSGDETLLSSYPPMRERVSRGLNVSAEATTPSATRVKLVGGDKDNAVLRTENYDRAQKKWVAGKTLLAAPGRGIGASGWTLKGLRFDNFTLVADVTDDGGVDRVLTTKD
jgi:hypothetical protein